MGVVDGCSFHLIPKRLFLIASFRVGAGNGITHEWYIGASAPSSFWRHSSGSFVRVGGRIRPGEVKECMSRETVSLGGNWVGNNLANAQAKFEERLRDCGLQSFTKSFREFAKCASKMETTSFPQPWRVLTRQPAPPDR
ncbi:hypothetical protein V8C44DRAFT_337713 [Trichoderma aethiopicum]